MNYWNQVEGKKLKQFLGFLLKKTVFKKSYYNTILYIKNESITS